MSTEEIIVSAFALFVLIFIILMSVSINKSYNDYIKSYEEERKRKKREKQINDTYNFMDQRDVLDKISNIYNTKYEGIDPSITSFYMKKASIWYSLHKDHVDKLVSNAKTGYPPTDSLDIKNPNLWKSGHWKWYLDNPILLLED